MAKRLSYADALKILGKKDSAVLDLAEKLAEGGLGMLGFPDLFGARELLVGKGREALEGLRDKLRGTSRLDRTDRIHAAHQILVVIAFFEALEEGVQETGASLDLATIAITGEDHWRILDQIPSRALPGNRLSLDGRQALFPYLLNDFQSFLAQLPAARHEESPADTEAWKKLRSLLPHLAYRRYEEYYRLLSVDVPEFGMWVHLDEHTGTREAIGTGLAELRDRLEAISSHQPVDQRRRELFAGYQAVLRRPVLRSDDAPPGLSLPALEEAYVSPRARLARGGPSSTPSVEEWWKDKPLHQDLQPLMAALLTHPRTQERPILVLGHPGAGKSKFTEVLAARLPAADFLSLRVELRAVKPNSPIHMQIEEGLAAQLHTRVSWRDLVESADGALPVVILDGFDELLQATGVDRSDYLERVQEFQERQAAMGQPVAVIVTSRTMVVNRTRLPSGATVIRLEPFDEAQIGQMVRVWNKTNAQVFTSRGLLPSTTDVVLQYRELAEQPLLLLMLLVYDAGNDALRSSSETLTHGELYERLLTMFAKREVEKHRSGLSRPDFDDAVEAELRRLEIAALAMFTRRKQSVSADELDRDLEVLMPDAAVRPADADLHGQIEPAYQVLGRFFFVHEARAQVFDGTASVFEFLHATFGEYLVARAVVAALEDLEQSRSRSSRRRGRTARPDDGELYALSSFASYAGRDKAVDFLAELLGRRLVGEPDAREDYADLLIELFREAPFPASNRSYTDYEPVRLPLTRREANYTSNLMVLLSLVREEPVDVRELFPDTPEPVQALQGTSTLWRALPGAEWFSILSALRVRHLDGWEEGGPVTVIGREDGSSVDVGECMGFELRANTDVRPAVTDPYGITVPYESTTSRLLRSMAMRVNGTAARFTIGLLPYLRHVSDDLGTWYLSPSDDTVWTDLHEVMRLRLEPGSADPGQRLPSYQRLLSQQTLGRLELLVLKQAAEDLSLVPHGSDHWRRVRAVVNDYLSAVRTVVSGPHLREEAIGPVLRVLHGHIPEFDPARVLGLLDRDPPEAVLAQGTDLVPASRRGEPPVSYYSSGGENS